MHGSPRKVDCELKLIQHNERGTQSSLGVGGGNLRVIEN